MIYTHCVKNVPIRSFVWSVVSCIWTKYRDLRSKSPYSVQIQEDMDQKKLRIWTLFIQCKESKHRLFLVRIFCIWTGHGDLQSKSPY